MCADTERQPADIDASVRRPTKRSDVDSALTQRLADPFAGLVVGADLEVVEPLSCVLDRGRGNDRFTPMLRAPEALLGFRLTCWEGPFRSRRAFAFAADPSCDGAVACDHDS